MNKHSERQLRRPIVVRPAAEVTTKSRRTRESFMRALRSSVKDALKRQDLECVVRKSHSRVYAETDEAGAETAAQVLARVFGIGSFAVTKATSSHELASIVQTGAAVFGDLVRGRRFAVRVKRSGHHPYTSVDVERELGAALAPLGKVDLTRPEVTAYVEITGTAAHFFDENRPGPGGLPSGAGGHAVALLSGGFDSAVAAWYAMKRGLTLDYVFCNLGGDAYERQVVQVAKVLTDGWSFGARPRMHVLDFQKPLAELQANTREDLWQVVLKRLMYRAASLIARKCRAEAIVTGESLGQVSSQTLGNLRAIETASELPVLRPLIGFDKQEIIAKSEELGTAPLSARVKEYCAISNVRPVVHSNPDDAAAEEAKLDSSLLETAVASARVVKLRSLKPADLIIPYLFTDSLPHDAVVIDCQPRHMFEAWHAPGARHFLPHELIERARQLDKGRTYVLYCPYGTQSAHAAEVLQQLGLDAYSFRGGTGALKRHLERLTSGAPAAPPS